MSTHRHDDDRPKLHDPHHDRSGGAPDDPEPDCEMALLERAIRELLIEKGVLTSDQIRAEIERMERLDGTVGGHIVGRAWTDTDFRELLLRDAREAVRSLGHNYQLSSDLAVLADTQELHHLVVCTLCSCYPRGLLGRPPSWYKSSTYRARAVRDPRAVLAEFGTVLPEGVALRVVDSTADLRYLVLPLRPPGTEGWGEANLAALVTRDCLIGVTLPKVP